MEELAPEDWCIAELALLTGYRIDDIIQSRRDAWAGDTVTLTEQKTGKKRSVKIDHPIRAVVDKLNGITNYRNNGFLCPSRRRRRGDGPTLSRCTVWRAWKRACHNGSVTGRGYTVHSLRKCYAVRLWRATGSLEAVQRDLGHDRPTTTMIYLKDAMEALLRSCNTIRTVAGGKT